MARTILEIAKEAAERHATAPAPVRLFGSNDRIARILRTAAKDIMRDYLIKTNWHGTSEFQSTWTFSLQPGRYSYQMPPDFLKVIPRTEMRTGWEMGLVGPATPQAWSRWLSGAVAVTAPMGWRIRNNMLFIEPVPRAVELVSIEYISRYPVVSVIQDGDYDFTTNPIQTKAPVVPRDGFLSVKSPAEVAPPGPNDATFDTAPPGYDVAKWPEEISEALRRIDPMSLLAPVPMVRREAFTADSDLPAFDDDHVLSLGMTFKLRQGLGLNYVEAAAEYEEHRDAKIADDAGGPRDFHVGDNHDQNETVPLGAGVWMLS